MILTAVFGAWPIVGARLLLVPERHGGSPRVPDGYTAITITAPDGVALAAWFRPAEEPDRPLGVVLHGVTDDKRRGLRVAALDARRRLNWLLLDLRAHGESGGDACTYGLLEKEDLSAAIGRAVESSGARVAPKVAVYGESLGGAVALLAAERDPRIVRVWTEAAFADLETAIADRFEKLAGFRSRFLVGLAVARAESVSPLRVAEVSPRSAAARLSIPLVVAHGTLDRHVLPVHAERIVDAARGAPRELYWVEGATHLDLWEKGGTAYRERLVAFLVEGPG